MQKAMVGIIGGTGLGDDLAAWMTHITRRTVTTPFGRPSGPILTGTLGGYKVAFLNRHGPGHRLNPSQVPYAANIFALKKIGVRAIIATGAVGSLRGNIRPGDVVLVDQFIDKTFRRLGTFFDAYGAVHCEMAQPVCNRLHKLAIKAANQAKIRAHGSGTYVCMEGPQFSPRAESLMHKAWGADLIGMTAMPEAKLAREAQLCYCLVGLVSDYDCWQMPSRHQQQRLLEHIMANIKAATDNGLRLIRQILQIPGLVDDTCRCRHSLDLAVWTDRGQIPGQQARRLGVLFE
ncbi:MAG: MTAP family purine nucleoside phosphorylase [Sedimentisphaerales bacterium]|nr:MTAP family purine nucleoside phosphorylase [Sedimentisphaerales bacterium]